MKKFRLRYYYFSDYLNSYLTLPENIALIEEQLRIERVAMLAEIASLREALYACSPEINKIKTWEQRTDELYERLYVYQLGYCSKMKKKYPIFLPYSYRRTIRTFFFILNNRVIIIVDRNVLLMSRAFSCANAWWDEGLADSA